MYGAMRERAPVSTRFTGVLTTACVTLAAGYALATGMGFNVTRLLPEPILYVSLPDPKPPEPAPESRVLDTNSDIRLHSPDPSVLIEDFRIADPPITGSPDAPPVRPDIAANIPGPAKPPIPPVRVGAKMLPAASPAYPASEVRKGNEGISTLDICLDARGRVTSAALKSSSGHPVLDNAALKWVRDLRFTPASVGGTAQAICGHSVVYEWTLKSR